MWMLFFEQTMQCFFCLQPISP